MPPRSSGGRVCAVLGPTNTGKTHLALERMSGYATAMIGFPLRLLARENYDWLARVKGEGAVALLTGEEKIVPPRATHFVCTVESMPLDRRVDFLAVDEIQLCADRERGHVFTDRLLRARGEAETMFMGAETIRPLLHRLVPEAEFIVRPRFSKLSYTGPRKLARLPPRSAVVVFSAAEVYALAELLRRQRGGAAVVLGALSPRTRNAQVGLYQSGEVDYLVATDAIGMGLNMDVDHVAFAATRKFDGRAPRELDAAEVAQIAGRAGRHMNDGTFGTTTDIPPLAGEIVEAVENHSFPPLRRLQWRNPELRFTSIEALFASLDKAPDQPGLIRARDADDQLALLALARDEEVARRISSSGALRLLWDVCQIPDFGKVRVEEHARLLKKVFLHLSGRGGRLPDDWLNAEIARIDHTEGGVETLIGRIAAIRVWTYVSHRADWVADAAAWRARTRDVEDRLSDALHERLTQRFVDRRTAHLVRRLKTGESMASSVSRDGKVAVDGHFVGSLDGFRFQPDRDAGGEARRAVLLAAGRSLTREIAGRVEHLLADGHDGFALGGDGVLSWRGGGMARLAAGPDVLKPVPLPFESDLLEPGAREAVRRKLATWLERHLRTELRALFAAVEAPLEGAARGLAWQLGQALGSMPSAPASPQIAALDAPDRKALARLGVRLGVESVFLPALLKPRAQGLRALLWATYEGVPPTPIPELGHVSIPVGAETPPLLIEAAGYRPLGPRALRVDMLERFAAGLRHLARQGEFVVPPPMLSQIGLSSEGAIPVIEALGYRARPADDGALVWRRPSRRPGPRGSRRGARTRDASPFEKLRRPA